jgi:quinol monooxygenase YgiN
MADTAALYGVIGKIRSAPGMRAELSAYLAAGSRDLPGNRIYLIAEDRGDPDGLWVTEVWDNKEAHAASLKLPQVQQAIANARPIIAGFETRAEVTPVEGMH